LHSEPPIPVLLMARELGQGGSERQLVEIAKALDRSRFSVHVGCFRPEGFRSAELASQGIPIVHFPVYSLRSFSAVLGAWQLGNYIRRHGIRLVHTFDTPMNCFAVPAARAFRTPVVISSQRAARGLSSRPEQFVLRITDHLVDAVVVNCEAVRRHMMEDEGVQAERLRTCYNGLDTGRFRPLPKQRPPVLEGASLVIGVVCALRPEKGLPTLVEAFAKVVSSGPSDLCSGLRLAIVGSGRMLETLQAMTVGLGVQDRCHFEPSTADVTAWLRAIDIFVLPSLSEALSNSLMEAMACGCAVVASAVGGNPELVSEGTTGFLFPAGNASELAGCLQRLVVDEPLRTRLGAEASDRVRQHFSLEASVQRMQQIYDELLGRRGAAIELPGNREKAV
jgi:glycosyltransferase involved in cell wall biosynthesis